MPQVSTPTHLDFVQSNSNGNPLTSSSISPTGDALLIAVASWRDPFDNKTFDGFTSTFATGGWTTLQSTTSQGASNMGCAIGWAITDSSPGSGTVSCNWSGNNTNSRLAISEIASNFDPTTPFAQSKLTIDLAPTTDGTDTLDSTPDADSIVFSFYSDYEDGLGGFTPTTGLTALTTQIANGINFNTAWADGGNGTAIGGTIATTAPDEVAFIFGAEIQPESGSSSILPLLNAYYG